MTDAKSDLSEPEATTSDDLIQPNGTRVHYARTSPGTGFADAVFESADPGGWTHSIISRNQARLGWDMTFRDGRKLFFPQFQPVSEITDRNGNTTRIVREANNGSSGKITQVISPNGRTVDYTYNSAGFVSALTDNLGRSFAYNYDDAGHLVEIIDPLGGKRQFTWDSDNNRITAIRDPNGNTVIQNEYDADGRVHKQTLANGSIFTYMYTVQDGRIVQTEVTDPRGSIRRVEFNEAGYVVKSTFPLGEPDEQVTTYEVTDGRVTASVDSLNRRTTLEYDPLGNLTRITKLAGTANAISVAMTYDSALSVLRTVTDPNGNTNTLTYDPKGNLTGVSNALNQTATFTYNAQGRLLTTADPVGRVTTLTYDGGDLSSVTDALGRQTQFATDAAGRVISTVDALGNRGFREWDDQDRLLSTTDALGGITVYSYDGNGNLRSHTDAKSHTTRFAYNELNQLKLVTDPLLKERTLQYEAGGGVKQIVDREGQLRSVIYDPLGRPKLIGFGATEVHPTAYKSQIENTFDAGSRLTLIVDKTCYDPVNNPNCSHVATVNVIARAYDDLDRLTREITPQGEVNYTFDNGGRRKTMTIKNGPSGTQVVQPTITYSYDNANRLTGIVQAAGVVNDEIPQNITLTYDAAGQRTQTTLANGITVTYGRDNAGQLTAIVYKKANGALIGDLLYGYDAAGRRTSMSGSLAQLNLPPADILDASYDANDRLTTWASSVYAYDNNGNLTSDGVSAYQWDERNQLASISDGSSDVASFQYDSLGRRTAKSIASVTSGFLYDGSNLVQELEGVTSSAAVRVSLLAGGPDEVFSRIEGSDSANRQSVLSDANNSTVMLLNAAQDETVRFSYEPYGVTSADTAYGGTQQYTGRENDNSNSQQGLYYFRARYYMPGTARFISEDPIGWASGQTNNYAYVGGNPISFRDPSGLDGWDNFENFSAGFGDGLTFGLTGWLRKQLGIDGVDECSGWYAAGGLSGMAVQLVATLGVSAEARGAEVLASRAQEVHSVLDPIAQAQRTTAVLDSTAGRIVAGGARDLTPLQRASLLPDEIAAALPTAHAEITALQAARGLGGIPEALGVTRAICPACQAAIEASGGRLTSATTAIWPR